jgi:hypothetical protein
METPVDGLAYIRTKPKQSGGKSRHYYFRRVNDAWMVYDYVDCDDVTDHVIEYAQEQLDGVVTRKKYRTMQLTLDQLAE